ncbi:hypothetical protein OEB99_12170 [Actinotalea sp. M2MS4P-6]|uniref:hypothetical protein n=1 Tax=Actinotalea sp. M2MS4P-6 TaxID=2983762 RepID=UPI0021E51546|nr:hypothetical protein [Actinotalea sp. M2MS4P-6]MCV2395065.1 hypothetical protein [Actinotalea sp. M2MS4P-6]
MPISRRKSAAIALAVLGVAGLSLASASTLDLTGGTVQAGVTDLTDCQTSGDITIGFGTPGFAGGSYGVSSVVLQDVDAACAGKAVRVTLLDDAGSPVAAELTTTVASPFAGGDVSLTSAAVAAASISSVAVVISD